MSRIQLRMPANGTDVPTISDLLDGELAIIPNTGKLYYRMTGASPDVIYSLPYIDDSNVLYHDGNVGFGDASPSFTSGSGIDLKRAGITTMRWENSSTTKALEIRVDTDVTIAGLSSGQKLVFQTVATDRAVIDASGKLGVGTTNPDGTLHVHTASAGSVSAHANAADGVFENSTHGGISIITPNNVTGNIYFADTDSNTSGRISLNHNTDAMSIYINDVATMQIDDDATAGNTRFLIYDVDNATLERVSVGAADSGGAGYKVLRIPN